MKATIDCPLLRILLIVIYFIIPEKDLNVTAQVISRSYDSDVWLNIGGGIVSCKKMGRGPAAGACLSFRENIHLISLKYFFNMVTEYTRLSGFDIIYGLVYRKPSWYCALSTGIDFSTLKENPSRSPSPYDFFNYEWIPGIPADFRIFITGDRLGIGLNGYTVYNRHFSFSGISVCLQLGNLK
jgi:hypothetical protein